MLNKGSALGDQPEMKIHPNRVKKLKKKDKDNIEEDKSKSKEVDKYKKGEKTAAEKKRELLALFKDKEGSPVNTNNMRKDELTEKRSEGSSVNDEVSFNRLKQGTSFDSFREKSLIGEEYKKQKKEHAKYKVAEEITDKYEERSESAIGLLKEQSFIIANDSTYKSPLRIKQNIAEDDDIIVIRKGKEKKKQQQNRAEISELEDTEQRFITTDIKKETLKKAFVEDINRPKIKVQRKKSLDKSPIVIKEEQGVKELDFRKMLIKVNEEEDPEHIEDDNHEAVKKQSNDFGKENDSNIAPHLIFGSIDCSNNREKC